MDDSTASLFSSTSSSSSSSDQRRDNTFAAWVSDARGATGVAVLRPRAREGGRADLCARELVLFEFIDALEALPLLAGLLNLTQPSSVLLCEGCVAEEVLVRAEQAVEQANDCVPQRAPRAHFGASAAEVSAQLETLHGAPVAHVEHMRQALRAAACLVKQGSLLKAHASALAAAAAGEGEGEGEGAAEGNGEGDAGGGGGGGGGGGAVAALPAAAPSGPRSTVRVTAGALDRFLRLDAGAARALNLFASRQDGLPVAVAVAYGGVESSFGGGGGGGGGGGTGGGASSSSSSSSSSSCWSFAAASPSSSSSATS